MSTQTFNLLDTYEISVVDNKIHWVEADEWSPYEAGFTDLVDPDDIFTDYHHGEAEIIEDILVLNRPNQMTGREEDASRFYEELKANPEWSATYYYVTSLNKRFPVIRYCHSGQHVSFGEAIYVMLKLGFNWDPDSDRFVRADLEEESARRFGRIKAMFNRGNFRSLNTDNKEI